MIVQELCFSDKLFYLFSNIYETISIKKNLSDSDQFIWSYIGFSAVSGRCQMNAIDQTAIIVSINSQY